MGRLYWSFDQAMKSDCLAIIMGFQGNKEAMSEDFGSPEPEQAKEPELPPLTPEALRGMFAKS